jgi:hypothetical protein
MLGNERCKVEGIKRERDILFEVCERHNRPCLRNFGIDMIELYDYLIQNERLQKNKWLGEFAG